MIFKIHLKSPDAIDQSISDAVDNGDIQKDDVDECSDAASRWFTYGEYLTIEIDTDKGTCVVCKP